MVFGHFSTTTVNQEISDIAFCRSSHAGARDVWVTRAQTCKTKEVKLDDARRFESVLGKTPIGKGRQYNNDIVKAAIAKIISSNIKQPKNDYEQVHT